MDYVTLQPSIPFLIFLVLSSTKACQLWSITKDTEMLVFKSLATPTPEPDTANIGLCQWKV